MSTSWKRFFLSVEGNKLISLDAFLIDFRFLSSLDAFYFFINGIKCGYKLCEYKREVNLTGRFSTIVNNFSGISKWTNKNLLFSITCGKNMNQSLSKNKKSLKNHKRLFYDKILIDLFVLKTGFEEQFYWMTVNALWFMDYEK